MVLWRVALQVPAKNDGFSSKSNRRLTRRAAAGSRRSPEAVENWFRATIGAPQQSCHLDADGDGIAHSETDGYIVYRYIAKWDDQKLIENGLGEQATRVEATEIRAWLDKMLSDTDTCSFDVDGDGIALANTDGLLIYRFLQGITGDAMTNGIVAAAGIRKEPEVIYAWIMEQYFSNQ